MIRRALLATFALIATIASAQAQRCSLDGMRVSCDDGRVGMLNGDAIVWPDGTRSSRTPHPSVRIGPGVHIGPNVFVGSPSGIGNMPLDDPNSPFKRACAIVNEISYCH